LALCDAQGCPQKIEEAPPLEIKPAPAKPKVAATKTKFSTAAKTAKFSPDQPGKQTEKVEQKSAVANTAKSEPQTSAERHLRSCRQEGKNENSGEH
jgi:hypothetical protein